MHKLIVAPIAPAGLLAFPPRGAEPDYRTMRGLPAYRLK